MLSAPIRQRALASYLGLAMGDALGATVEFMTPMEIRASHKVLREILGGGWLRLKAGKVTDDTEMCLALGRSLIEAQGFDAKTFAVSMVQWLRSRPPDIGHTCRRGIRRFMTDGSLEAPFCEDAAGNGGCVRNLPVVLSCLEDTDSLQDWSHRQSLFTHHHPAADAAVRALANLTRLLILGAGRKEARAFADAFALGNPLFRFDPWPRRTSGYVVDTLQSAFDAFFSTDSFEACLILAVNRGGDADSIGAIAGQLAGAFYGLESLPKRWLRQLDSSVSYAIGGQCEALLDLSHFKRSQQANLASGQPHFQLLSPS